MRPTRRATMSSTSSATPRGRPPKLRPTRVRRRRLSPAGPGEPDGRDAASAAIGRVPWQAGYRLQPQNGSPVARFARSIIDPWQRGHVGLVAVTPVVSHPVDRVRGATAEPVASATTWSSCCPPFSSTQPQNGPQGSWGCHLKPPASIKSAPANALTSTRPTFRIAGLEVLVDRLVA
jgi:hypothetical protein